MSTMDRKSPYGKLCLCSKPAIAYRHGWVCERCAKIEKTLGNEMKSTIPTKPKK